MVNSQQNKNGSNGKNQKHRKKSRRKEGLVGTWVYRVKEIICFLWCCSSRQLIWSKQGKMHEQVKKKGLGKFQRQLPFPWSSRSEEFQWRKSNSFPPCLMQQVENGWRRSMDWSGTITKNIKCFCFDIWCTYTPFKRNWCGLILLGKGFPVLLVFKFNKEHKFYSKPTGRRIYILGCLN